MSAAVWAALGGIFALGVLGGMAATLLSLWATIEEADSEDYFGDTSSVNVTSMADYREPVR